MFSSKSSNYLKNGANEGYKANKKLASISVKNMANPSDNEDVPDMPLSSLSALPTTQPITNSKLPISSNVMTQKNVDVDTFLSKISDADSYIESVFLLNFAVKNKPESGGMMTRKEKILRRGTPYTEYTYKESNKKPSAQQPTGPTNSNSRALPYLIYPDNLTKSKINGDVAHYLGFDTIKDCKEFIENHNITLGRRTDDIRQEIIQKREEEAKRFDEFPYTEQEDFANENPNTPTNRTPFANFNIEDPNTLADHMQLTDVNPNTLANHQPLPVRLGLLDKEPVKKNAFRPPNYSDANNDYYWEEKKGDDGDDGDGDGDGDNGDGDGDGDEGDRQYDLNLSGNDPATFVGETDIPTYLSKFNRAINDVYVFFKGKIKPNLKIISKNDIQDMFDDMNILTSNFNEMIQEINNNDKHYMFGVNNGNNTKKIDAFLSTIEKNFNKHSSDIVNSLKAYSSIGNSTVGGMLITHATRKNMYRNKKYLL